ncbi:MAG: T9SS type A sorting domain-containing protein [Candidatus Kapaibacterium sp.]
MKKNHALPLITVLLLLAIVIQRTNGQTSVDYYVSSATGSDTNPGTADRPFRTLQKCVDQWNGTDQATCNCSGTFNEEVVIKKGGPSPSYRNRLIAWDTDGDGRRDDETFVLDGQNSRNIAIQAQDVRPKPDNVEIGWIDFRNYTSDGGCGSKGEVHFIKLKCFESDGCADWWIHHNTFTNLAMPCQAEESHIAIRPTHTPNLLVERNRFDSLGGYIMRYVHGSDITFRRNYVHVLTAGIKAWGNPDRLKILNNVFVGDGNGFNPPKDSVCGAQNVINFSNNVQDGVIRGNVFIDCGTSIAIGTSDDFGLRDNAHHVIAKNVIYRSERICNRYNAPIVIDDRSSINDNGDTMRVYDILIKNNVILYDGDTDWNQGAGIELQAGHPYPFNSDIRIYHNTILGFHWGVRADESYVPVRNGARYAYQLNSVDLKNNIFAGIRNAQYTLGTSGSWSNGTEPQNWRSDYNTFSTVDNFRWNGSKSLLSWNNTGRDSNSFICAPTFVAGDTVYHLATTDLCAVDRGIWLNEAKKDIDGDRRVRGTAVDIGADEVVTGLLKFGGSGDDDDDERENESESGEYPEIYFTASPNPVRGSALIEFDLPQTGVVSLSLYDITGRHAATLLSEEVMEHGRQSLPLSTADFEPGIYTLQLEVGGETYEQSVVVLK